MEKMCMMKKKAWTKGDGMEISNILMRDGLSLEVLHKLSFESKLGINLKKNLHYFDKESLLEELQEAGERIFVEFENAVVKPYFNERTHSIEDSIKADAVTLVKNS